jgi:DoxX-like family
MKKNNTLYWIVTGLFAGFLIFTAVPDIILEKEAVTMINGLGYPNYFIRFIGIAKVLGAIDLFAAVYSIIAVEGVTPNLSFMLLAIGFLFLSYYLWHTKKTLA